MTLTSSLLIAAVAAVCCRCCRCCCGAVALLLSRLQDRIYDAFVERFAKQTAALTIGNGATTGVQLGPLINDAALKKVEALVGDATVKVRSCLWVGCVPVRHLHVRSCVAGRECCCGQRAAGVLRRVAEGALLRCDCADERGREHARDARGDLRSRRPCDPLLDRGGGVCACVRGLCV